MIENFFKLWDWLAGILLIVALIAFVIALFSDKISDFFHDKELRKRVNDIGSRLSSLEVQFNNLSQVQKGKTIKEIIDEDVDDKL